MEGIDKKLVAATIFARNILPEEYHAAIRDSTLVSRGDYRKVVDTCDQLCKQLGIQYICSLMEVNGRIVVTSASSAGGRAAGGDSLSFFGVRTDPGAFEKAFRTMEVQYSTFPGRGGTGRMALVPVYDHQGRKHLFAAGAGMGDIGAELRKTVAESILVGLIVMAASILLVFFLAHSLSHPIVKLTRAAHCIARGDLQQTADTGGALELRSLSESINSMSGALRSRSTELQDCAERLDVTLGSIGDAVIVIDSEGRVTRVNQSAERLTGWMRSEAAGRPLGAVFCVINAKTRQPLDDPMNRMMKSGMTVVTADHTALIARDGVERRISGTIAPLRNGSGQISGAVLAFHKTADEIEPCFRQIFDSMPAGAVILKAVDHGRDFVLEDMNPAGESLAQVHRTEVLGRRLTEVFPGVADSGLLDMFRRVWNTGTAEQENQTLYQDSRMTQWVENSVCRLSSGLIASFFIDATSRHEVEETLRLSEEKFSKVFLFSPNMVALSDLETGKFIEVNRGFLEAFGYRREEVIGNTPEDLNLWADPEDREKVLSRFRKDGMARNIEVRFRSRNEEEIHSLLSLGTVELSGKPALLSIANNLTRQERMRRELREKSEILNTVLLVAPVGITLVENHTVGWTNDTLLRLFGYSREELYSQSSEMLYYSPEEFRDATKRITVQLKAGQIAQTEAIFRKKDGSILHGLLHVSGLDPVSPESRAIATITDITWKKRAESELTAEKERILVTLRSIGDAVVASDTGGKVILMNRAAEELTGWPQTEAMGNPLPEVVRVIDGKTRKSGANPVENVLGSGAVIGLAHHSALISRDGIQRSIEGSGAPICDSSGAITGVVLVIRDVTAKRRQEEELRKIQNLESVGVLAGGIAHDFNNILTGILGSISLAKMSVDTEHEIYPILTEAEDETCRARDLTQQLLTFSKGGAPIRKVTSISELLRTTATFALRGSKSRCEFSLPEDLWPAVVDEGQVCQVISNLVINADQAMPQGGIILVSAANVNVEEAQGLPIRPGMYIRISVVDQGSGIPREHLSHIFNPYFSTKETGHGLGLATTHSIVRKHDGHIRVESEPGVGTTFQVYFPALERRSVPRSAPAYSLHPGSEKILVMDDEESIRYTTKELLVRSGYIVETARNGDEAVEQYRAALESKSPFALVIMDLTVPGGMGGLEALASIREFSPEVKAIVSSGYSGDPIMADFARYGFRGVVSKPYRFEDLIRVIRSILDR